MSKNDVELQGPVDEPTIIAPPDFVSKSELNDVVANAVAAALAGALPSLMDAVKSMTPNVGNLPSPSVFMTIGETAAVENTFLKHYRLDNTPSGKFIEINMSMVEAGYDPNEAVMKGSWIHFKDGHFYATTPNQVKFIEWLRNKPMDAGGRPQIYEASGSQIIYCEAVNCHEAFTNQADYDAHLAGTHGLNQQGGFSHA